MCARQKDFGACMHAYTIVARCNEMKKHDREFSNRGKFYTDPLFGRSWWNLKKWSSAHIVSFLFLKHCWSLCFWLLNSLAHLLTQLNSNSEICEENWFFCICQITDKLLYKLRWERYLNECSYSNTAEKGDLKLPIKIHYWMFQWRYD